MSRLLWVVTFVFLASGIGFIDYVGGSTFQPPRQGTLEMRLQF
jgi:phage shock protein PspC (stress-responsive transcriptional regulator)